MKQFGNPPFQLTLPFLSSFFMTSLSKFQKQDTPSNFRTMLADGSSLPPTRFYIYSRRILRHFKQCQKILSLSLFVLWGFDTNGSIQVAEKILTGIYFQAKFLTDVSSSNIKERNSLLFFINFVIIFLVSTKQSHLLSVAGLFKYV